MATRENSVGKGNRVILTRCITVMTLFCFWPLITFVHANLNQLDVSGLSFIANFFSLVLISSFIAFYIGYRASRRIRPIAVATSISIAVLFFFNYHLIHNGITHLLLAFGFSNAMPACYGFRPTERCRSRRLALPGGRCGTYPGFTPSA